MSAATAIGIIGTGNIFERYVDGLRTFDDLELVWCADIDVELARRRAEEAGIAVAGAPADALSGALGEVELVVNLTPPEVHAQVTRQAVLAGKHVYTEKPFALTAEEGRALLELAARHGRVLGGAPDWFLGNTGRAARAALAEGVIGTPIAVSAFIAHSQLETWHPNPTAFFRRGAGPVLDLGPYYASALVDCLGPIRAVAALERTGAPTRVVTAPDRVVDEVAVEVPTHAVALLEFASGVIGSLTMSFDAWERTMPFIEVYGTGGTLSLPMPHESDGALRRKAHGAAEWEDVEQPADPPYVRAIGVAEMARAIRAGRPPRASGALACHVVEVLGAVADSSARRSFVEIRQPEEADSA